MKIWLTYFLLICVFTNYAQTGNWTWMKGSNTVNSNGNYGTIGVASVMSEPPPRYQMGFWTDTAGNFWIYGGTFGSDTNNFQQHCDLWKFDPTQLEWTWMNGCNNNDSLLKDFTYVISAPKGIFDANNSPGSIGDGICAWTTLDNHLWLFGGTGSYDHGTQLWQYDPAINQWAWMGKSPGNYGIKGIGDSTTGPAGRFWGNTHWLGSDGNLWLFGGATGGSTNDVWKYDIPSGIWTWMSGSDTIGSHGSYGAIGVSSINHYPWSRMNHCFWKDADDNFWLAGGFSDMYDVLQDIWKFNSRSLEWTWVKGAQGGDYSDPVGFKCDSGYQNKEGERVLNSAVWKICDDLIINYGGFPDFSNSQSRLSRNDIWGYIPYLNEWVKIDDVPNTGPKYGTQGVATVGNYPPARYGSASFVDKKGGLWMFGGINDNYTLFYNDLWKYVMDSSCLPVQVCNIISGIDEKLRNEIYEVKIYPNPAANMCNLQMIGAEGIYSASLSDITGRQIQLLFTNQQISNFNFSVISLTAGIYLMKIADEKGSQVVKKLVVQH